MYAYFIFLLLKNQHFFTYRFNIIITYEGLTASAKPESVSIDLFLLRALAAASSLPLLIRQVGVGHFVFHLFRAGLGYGFL